MTKYNKLVLIIPPSPWLISDRDLFPNGPLYISAYLKAWKFEVQVCDLNGLPEEHWHIPVGDIYGVGGATPHYYYMKKIINILRERDPKSVIAVGGVHASALPDETMKELNPDYLVVGEGEQAMFDIMEGRRNKGQIVVGKKLKNLDILPFPDREALDTYDYLVPGIHGYLAKRREVSLITGRGCPFRCAFCSSCNIWGKPRYRSIDNVMKEITYLKDRYDIGLINFNDDTFVSKKDRVMEFCKRIEPMDINWYCLSRADQADLEMFKAMKRAGCQSITFGFETGSDRMLKVLNKLHRVKDSLKAIDIGYEAGVQVKASIMVGLPGETDEDIQQTAHFVKNPKLSSVSVHMFQPYPGSAIWNNPEKYDIEIDKETDFLDWHTCGKPDDPLSNNEQHAYWLKYVRSAAKGKNIESDLQEKMDNVR